MDVGAQHCHLGLHALWGLRAAGLVGGRSQGGWPGVRRCPSSGCPSSGAGSQGSASRVSRVRSVRACGPSTGPTTCALAGRRCSLWGWRKGVPGGGCFPPLRGASGVRRCPSPGRPSSGAGSQGSATRVSRVRSGRAWGPSTSCTACALAGRHCSLWGWRKGVPGGVPSTVVRGVRGQALSLPRLPAQWAGCWGPPPTCCGRGCVGLGAQHCPLGLHALCGLRAVGVVGGRPRGGWPATVGRGVWCQALSLPRPPVLWSGQPGFCDPFVPCVGTQHRPHGAPPCGLALRAVGVTEGRPRGGCRPPL